MHKVRGCLTVQYQSTLKQAGNSRAEVVRVRAEGHCFPVQALPNQVGYFPPPWMVQNAQLLAMQNGSSHMSIENLLRQGQSMGPGLWTHPAAAFGAGEGPCLEACTHAGRLPMRVELS